MKRERLAWLISLVLMALLAFRLPGSMGQRDDDYAFVRTLVDIHREVSENYVDPVNEQDLRQKAIDGMLSDLDPFSIYIPPAQQQDLDSMLDNSFRGVGVELDIQDGKAMVMTPIEGSPAFDAGVQAGDRILKVNGKSVDGLALPELAQRIAGPLGSTVTLTVEHDDGSTADLSMARREILLTTVKGWRHQKDATWDYYIQSNPKIAYVRITQFTDNTYDELHDALLGTVASAGKPAIPGIMDTGMKGLILDLRFNPGGRLEQAIKIMNLFVKDGVIVSTKGRNRPESIVRADGLNTLPNFPMVVLVNQHSASAAEIVSGSLKDNHRALVVGERTYGKGSVQELIPLDEDGGELKLTVAYYYLPSGRLVHRRKDATDWGVEPQINVPMDDAAQLAVMKKFTEQEVIPSTTNRATTRDSATQPVDAQLDAGVTALVGMIEMPQPATQPVTPTVTR